MKPNKDIEERLFSKLESFQSIDTEKDWEKVRERMGIQKERTMRPIWRIAATVIVLLSIGFLAQRYLDFAPDSILLEAGNQVRELELPDGSLVTLNKQAILVYPENFGRKHRELQLRGEAFFQVLRDPDSPFQVDVDQKARIRVLGTSFNIKSDDGNSAISVQVVEGKVAFSSLEGNDEIILIKDQQATLDEEGLIRDDTVDRNFLSWKTGKLFFYLESIENVCHELEDYYGIEIALHQSVPRDLTFTSTLNNQDLESVLDEISMVLGLAYRYDEQRILFTRQE